MSPMELLTSPGGRKGLMGHMAFAVSPRLKCLQLARAECSRRTTANLRPHRFRSLKTTILGQKDLRGPSLDSPGPLQMKSLLITRLTPPKDLEPTDLRGYESSSIIL